MDMADGFYFYRNRINAINSVTMTLKVWAIKNAYNGFLLSCTKRSLKFVSRPMEVNARVNQSPCRFFKLPFTASTFSGDITNEKSRDANTNPRTNFGKRSQMIFKVGLSRLVSSSTDLA